MSSEIHLKEKEIRCRTVCVKQCDITSIRWKRPSITLSANMCCLTPSPSFEVGNVIISYCAAGRNRGTEKCSKSPAGKGQYWVLSSDRQAQSLYSSHHAVFLCLLTHAYLLANSSTISGWLRERYGRAYFTAFPFVHLIMDHVKYYLLIHLKQTYISDWEQGSGEGYMVQDADSPRQV